MPTGALAYARSGAYTDSRVQHAVALEYLLNKYPEQRTWLEKHGFNTEELIDSLKWYPTEELEKLDAATAKAAARNVQREQLRKSSAQNYDRMQENLLRLLPVRVPARCCFFCRAREGPISTCLFAPARARGTGGARIGGDGAGRAGTGENE